VGGAERVVAALSLADSAVGLTLLALATTAELFALAWAAMRRGVSEIAVAGVVGSVAYNATASLGVALVRPLATSGILAPAIAGRGAAARVARHHARWPAEPPDRGRAGDRLRRLGHRGPGPLDHHSGQCQLAPGRACPTGLRLSANGPLIR